MINIVKWHVLGWYILYPSVSSPHILTTLFLFLLPYKLVSNLCVLVDLWAEGNLKSVD